MPKVAVVPLTPTLTVPLVIVRPPLNVFVALSVRVPTPILVIPKPVPLMAELTVRVEAALATSKLPLRASTTASVPFPVV